jgi:excisionase family DNA binding protein
MNTMSVKQAAAELGCSDDLVYILFADGDLTGFRVRKSIRIYENSLREFIERNQNKPRTSGVSQVAEKEPPAPKVRRQKPQAGRMVFSCVQQTPGWQAD